MRTFIAVGIKNENLVKALEELKRIDADIKAIKPENTHITLKFLGEVEEAKIEEIYKKMREKLDSFKKFKLALKGMGIFPSKKYMRVVWAGADSKEIMEIQKIVDDALSMFGFKKEKDFKSHLTLCRVKSARNKEKLAEFVEKYENFDFGTAEIDKVEIKKSELQKEGPTYTTLKEVALL